MLDYGKHITDIDHPQDNGNGYDQLGGDWGLFYKVARYFVTWILLRGLIICSFTKYRRML